MIHVIMYCKMGLKKLNWGWMAEIGLNGWSTWVPCHSQLKTYLFSNYLSSIDWLSVSLADPLDFDWITPYIWCTII